MLDIVAICGSLRAASTNGALIEAARLLAPAGMTVTRHDAIGTLPHFNADLDGPGLPEPVAAFRARLKAADGIIISSPEYARGIPGTLKNALDWLVGSSTLYGMPIVVLSASSTGGQNVLPAMALTLGYQGALVVATHGVDAPRSRFDAGGRLVDAEGEQERDDRLVSGLARFGQLASLRGQVNRFVWRGADVALALESGDDAADGDMRERELPGQRRDPRRLAEIEQLRDRLAVVLRRLDGVLAAHGGVLARPRTVLRGRLRGAGHASAHSSFSRSFASTV